MRKNPIPTVLALDVGNSMGYAFTGAEQRVYSGAAVFGKLKAHGARYQAFCDWLDPDHCFVEHIVIERVKFATSANARWLYGGWRACTQMHCERNGITFHDVIPTAWKATFTGSGRCSKEQSLRRAKALTKSDIASHDQADAIGLLYHFLRSEFGCSDSQLSSHFKQQEQGK